MGETNLQKITIYVTKEQYTYLKHLRKYRVSMSSFIRMLIAKHMMCSTSVEEHEITMIKVKKRRTWFKPSQLQKELLEELKPILARRKID